MDLKTITTIVFNCAFFLALASSIVNMWQTQILDKLEPDPGEESENEQEFFT